MNQAGFHQVLYMRPSRNQKAFQDGYKQRKKTILNVMENKKIRLIYLVDIEHSFIYIKFYSALSCYLNILLNIYDLF